MFTPRPSLLPATVAAVVAYSQLEIGRELASVIIGVANIVAATVLAVLGQRMRRASRSIEAVQRYERERKPLPVQSDEPPRKSRRIPRKAATARRKAREQTRN